MRHKQIIFRDASHTQDIHAQLWLPDTEPNCIIQMVHGIMEHGDRYAPFAEFLVSQGAALAIHDQMGHGKTALDGGTLGFFAEQDGWQNALQDVCRFGDILRERYPGVPIVLLGHSMGSFMCRCLLIQHMASYDGVVLSGTAHFSRFTYLFCRAFCLVERIRLGKRGQSKLIMGVCFHPYVKKFPEETHPAAWVTRDKDCVKRNGHDPLCRFVPSVSMFREVFKAMFVMGQRKQINKMRKDIPFLLASGQADPVGQMCRGVSAVYDDFVAAGFKDVELYLYPEARHEILNELNKDEVFADIWQWLQKKDLVHTEGRVGQA